ncbi:alpha/beta hydrolase [Albibacterium sp.]|uniref:alpha/beta hydrolase n=1 Tax=Albibacterium sp. TaxID=2952885 RepID=UPI002BF80B16|nr:alpha/beta hydrolase [Albibacterium sp.]HUH19820.1 alpha/beta hydrolase [Albibacterium sp.]
MKIGRCTIAVLSIVFLLSASAFAQVANPVAELFPKGTIIHNNIAYNNDTLEKHLLDIYMPANTTGKVPLIIWIHGGAWQTNSKYSDMSYMGNTIAEIINSGYALASIDYRYSTQAVFPAQIQDCNKAIAFLNSHADQYGFDKDKFVLMGFSSGGHLASLLGLSNNNKVKEFYLANKITQFGIKAVVDFYGPSDLISFPGSEDAESSIADLLGAAPLFRPDLAKAASPVTYVDQNDPPFLIIHGEKDDMVPPIQSKLLSSWLTLNGVKNDVIVVKDAPHYGKMFDAEIVRAKVMAFLKDELD